MNTKRTIKSKASLFFALALCLCCDVVAQSDQCPDDLYIGYRAEDRLNNPEDPDVGAIHLNIPKEDGRFQGELFFTFSGCQSRSIGLVIGNKIGPSLSGTWSGDVDGTSQSGSFTGSINDQGVYSGDYTVDKGRQFIEIEDCVEYYIAAFGTWSLFPILEQTSDDDLISFTGSRVEWTPTVNSYGTQCELFDLDEENCNAATTAVWQAIELSSTRGLNIPPSFLVDGNQYALACSQFDEQGNLLNFSKTLFAFPLVSLRRNIVLAPIYFLLFGESN